tara:strand:- start:112 stop:696 length:585 start_codon:yes stop_codon:yes gene_type:complete
MSKITIIIGLSGSGKTTITPHFCIDENTHVYADWGWKFKVDDGGDIDGSFDDEYRFNDLITDLKNGIPVILDGTYLCNHKFLCEAEYHLNLHFPNIDITKYYFENNPKDAIANVLHRESVGGNYWTKANGELIFHGHHFWEDGPNKGRRMYEVIIENINNFSKNYIIPNKYSPLKIQVQDVRFYEGWSALLREE